MSSGSYASSGLNRMGTKSSEPHVWENWSSPQSQPCFYRNKRYNSASEALDAYIRDYEGRLSSALQPQQGVQDLLLNNSSSSLRGISIHGTGLLERETEAMKKISASVEESCQKLISKAISPASASPATTSYSFAIGCAPVRSQFVPSSSEFGISSDRKSTAGESPHSSNYSHFGQKGDDLLSHSQLNSIRGRVLHGYGINDQRYPSHRDSNSCSTQHDSSNRLLIKGTYMKRGNEDGLDSDAGASSIIAGHMQAPKRDHVPSKMVSTPKCVRTNGGLLDISKSSVGPSLSLEDLRSYNKTKRGLSSTRHSSAFCAGRSSECPLGDVSSRSRSLHRGNASGSRSHSAAARLCQNPTKFKVGDDLGSRGCSSPAVDVKHQEFLQSLMSDIEKSSSCVDPKAEANTGVPSILNKSAGNKSVHFWDEDKAEDVLSPPATSGASDGFGYLERIKRLIHCSSPPCDTSNHSQQCRQDNPGGVCPSPTTEEILDGDRSWERVPPVNLAEFLAEDDKVTDTNVDAILDECVSIVSQHDQGTSSEPSVGLSGGSHPGGMEALKNMLFTVQSIADQEPVDSGLALTSSSKPDEKPFQSRPVASASSSSFALGGQLSLSSTLPLRKRHEEKMEKAMVSLTRLKSLVGGQ